MMGHSKHQKPFTMEYDRDYMVKSFKMVKVVMPTGKELAKKDPHYRAAMKNTAALADDAVKAQEMGMSYGQYQVWKMTGGRKQ